MPALPSATAAPSRAPRLHVCGAFGLCPHRPDPGQFEPEQAGVVTGASVSSPQTLRAERGPCWGLCSPWRERVPGADGPAADRALGPPAPLGLWGWGAVPLAELTPISSVCSLPGALASSPTSCEYLLGASCPFPGPCWVKRRVGRLLCGDSEWKAAPSVL